MPKLNQSEKNFYIPLEALDPVTYVQIIQQIEPGTGDYTKEKYEKPDITAEEFKIQLAKFRESKNYD